MKKIVIVLNMLVTFACFSQFSKDQGVAIRYSKEVKAKYSIYETPLRVNQVQTQEEIDYTSYEGLMQSFYSASNREWALSEYLDGRKKIVRDEEHFNAVKRNNVDKNYLQIETVYEYDYYGRSMAFVKYSFIVEKIPFPVIGVISMEKVKNRWYISDLLNQENMIIVFSNFEPSVLLELLRGQSDDKLVSDLIDKTRGKKNSLDFEKLVTIYRGWIRNKERGKIVTVKDKRLTIEGYKSADAKLNQSPKVFKTNGAQGFILEESFFEAYPKKSRLTNDDKTKKKYEGHPEYELINGEPTTLVFKMSFMSGKDVYSIIKYNQANSLKVTLLKKEGKRYKTVNGEFTDWLDLFKQTKSQLIYDLYDDEKLSAIKKQVFNESGVLDMNMLIRTIKDNKTSLSKYFE